MGRRNDLAPDLELRSVAVCDSKLSPRAIRKLEPAHVAELAASIGVLGFIQPLIVGPEFDVLDGAARLAAAKSLAMQSVPCVCLRHLSPPLLRAARVALNRLAERGAWDLDALKIEIEELIELDAPIEILGFDEAELDVLLMDEDGGRGAEPVPDVEKLAVSATGDCWLLKRHRVLCADALKASSYDRLMEGEKARFVLCDPPFNVKIAGHVSGLGARCHREFVQASGELSRDQFGHFLTTFLRQAAACVVDGGLLAAFMDWRSIDLLLAAGSAAGLELLNLIIWSKPNGGMGSLYRSAHELLPLFKSGQAAHLNNVALGKYGRSRTNVWEHAGASTLGSDARDRLADHPTPKPVSLLEDAIYDVTARGEVVLDPFLGSGSTLIAAHLAGRRCFGIELDPLYVDVTLRRWIQHTGQQPILAHSGETFAEVESRILGRRDRGLRPKRLAPPGRAPLLLAAPDHGGRSDG